jgi:glycosyltransferase involved in cell wall biosynthesis
VESLLHSAYRVPDHLIVAHENLKQRLIDEFRVDPTDVSVIPLPSPSVDRVDGSTEPQEIEFLFFGTLRDNKGIEDLLSAIRLLDPALPLRFVFAGRGEAHLEALLRQSAASDPRIQVEIGWIDEPRQAELYSRAWAVVVPYTSAFAAQSGTVRVAYSFGSPVIASDVGALGAQVRADQSGWLVPERDPVALATCIEAAAASPQRRRELAATALQLGSERSAKVLAGDFRALYDSLLTDRS